MTVALNDFETTVRALREWSKGYCAPGGSRLQGIAEASYFTGVRAEVYMATVERPRRWGQRYRCGCCGQLIDHGQAALRWQEWDAETHRKRHFNVHHDPRECAS